MLEINSNDLYFSYPEVHQYANLRVRLYITNGTAEKSLPLHHIDDFENVPPEWKKRGGVITPVAPGAFMYLKFVSGYPFAVKVACGKINALTGKLWENELNEPQDYLSTKDQEFLTGYKTGKNTVSKFMATKLGDGFTPEEQITGEASFGGIQIICYPLKASVYKAMNNKKISDEPKRNPDVMYSKKRDHLKESTIGLSLSEFENLTIHEDQFGVDSWETSSNDRCYIHLCHSKNWTDYTRLKEPEKLSTENIETLKFGNLDMESFLKETQTLRQKESIFSKLKSFFS